MNFWSRAYAVTSELKVVRTEYLGSGPIEIPLAGTGSHTIEAYSVDCAHPANNAPHTATAKFTPLERQITSYNDPAGPDCSITFEEQTYRKRAQLGASSAWSQ